MKIHEYQAKEVLRQYAILSPRGKACFSVEEAVAAATEIVRACKTFSVRRINEFRETSGVPVWQRNYYEHIIRNDADYNRIAECITDNPQRRLEDSLHPEAMKFSLYNR